MTMMTMLPEKVHNARREIEQYEQSRTAWHSNPTNLSELANSIDAGTRSFSWTLEADESFRDQLAQGSPYSSAMDAVLFSMLYSWAQLTERFTKFVAQYARAEQGIIVKPLAEALSQARAILEPPLEIRESPLWLQFLRRVECWLSAHWLSARSCTFEDARRFWNGVPVVSILQALRRQNLAARGLEEAEIHELGDVRRFPGTILGELQERYWHARNIAEVN